VNLKLKNKKIIISAGASGIGWTTTKECLKNGATVFICDVNKKFINKSKKHPLNNKKLFSYECDASNEKEVSNFFTKILKKTKKVDALINNVGIAGPTGTLEKLKSKDWEQTLKINVISHFYFSKLAIPMLKKNKGGSIINLSSTAGIHGFPLRSPYAASKAAVANLTKTLAGFLGPEIRVNALAPGWLEGDWMEQMLGDNYEGLMSRRAKYTPLKRVATATDVGEVAVNLAENNKFVTGEIITIDGGFTSTT